jgi:hypothetical protein
MPLAFGAPPLGAAARDPPAPPFGPFCAIAGVARAIAATATKTLNFRGFFDRSSSLADRLQPTNKYLTYGLVDLVLLLAIFTVVYRALADRG